MMMKRSQICICLTALLSACCSLSIAAQRKPPATSKTVEGVLYAVGSGQHVTSFLLQTQNGVMTLNADDKTRYIHFEDAASAWGLGARWVVTYRGGRALSIAYTGGKDAAIAGSERAAERFLNALTDGDFDKAYSQLSPALKRKLSLEDFTQMYKGVEFNVSSVDVCSSTGDKIKLLLAPGGSDVPPYQPAEAVLVGDKWLLDRLEPFTETPTACKTP